MLGFILFYLFICAALDKKIVQNSTKSFFFRKQDAAFVKIPFQSWEVLWMVNN